jgi:hypothetical protein
VAGATPGGYQRGRPSAGVRRDVDGGDDGQAALERLHEVRVMTLFLAVSQSGLLLGR